MSVSNHIILPYHIHWGDEVRKKGVAATGFEPASPGRDLNPQSLAPRASTLSIRSPGALPVSYTAIKLIQPYLSHPSKFIATNLVRREGKGTWCAAGHGFWWHLYSLIGAFQRVNIQWIIQRISKKRAILARCQLDTQSGILFSSLTLKCL